MVNLNTYTYKIIHCLIYKTLSTRKVNFLKIKIKNDLAISVDYCRNHE